MKKISLLIVLFLLVASCENNDTIEAQAPPLPNAKVLYRGMDCGNTYLIQFNDDAVGVPPNSYNDIFYALHLPAAMQVNNLDVYVEFHEPNSSEIMACSTMGMAFPQIVIENP